MIQVGYRTSISNVLITLAAVCLSLRVFFYSLLAKEMATLFFFVGTFFMGLYAIRIRGGLKIVLKCWWGCYFWLAISVYALISCIFVHGTRVEETALMVIVVLLMIILSSSTKWTYDFLRKIGIILSIFALTTLFFFIFQDLFYPMIKHSFYMDIEAVKDYKSGITAHYSDNGSYCALGMVISYCLWHFGDKDVPQSTRLMKILCPIFTIALILTTKRGQLLAALLAIVLTYLLLSGKGKYTRLLLYTVGTIVLLLVLELFVPAISDSIDRLLSTFAGVSSIEDVTTGRIFLWKHAIQGWKNSGIMGNGWASFRYAWTTSNTVSTIAHNELLNLLFENGTIITIIICTLIIKTLTMSIRVAKNANKQFLSVVSAGIALQIYALVYGFSSGSLFGSLQYFFPYFLGVSVIVAVKPSLRHQQAMYLRA